ncbi:MAG: IS630 family transposase [Planctomycetes bacterium]|nr:IS630 family transposase [Planctomycetota bacterium]
MNGSTDIATADWSNYAPSRPTVVKQAGYEWVYPYAAVEPVIGHGVALQAPAVNIATMSVFLKMLADELDPDDHAVLIMDQAGWHKSKRLNVPDNITILYLPPYSPELNLMERLWGYLRSHLLSNRAFDDYQDLLDAGARAWQQLTPEPLQSVCSCGYLLPECQQ